MYRIILLSVIFIILLVLFAGCSGEQVITPGLSTIDDLDEYLNVEGSNLSDHDAGLLGIYQVNIDTASMTGTIEPLRVSSSIDVLESVDITGFLKSSPCRDCIRIMSVGLFQTNKTYLILELGIKHPFDVGDPGEEPTGRNRADLHVFNVEGILITDDPELISFPSLDMDIANGYLINPDGYTSYLDPMLDNIIYTESDAHPYILHFDDYSQGNFASTNLHGFEDILNPSGNLVMKMGSDYSIKEYVFMPPPGRMLSFSFAVGCSYGITTEDFTKRFSPEYRCPQHNKKAASDVGVNITYNDLERGNPQSLATLSIEVMDINHDAETGSGLDKMAYESKVSILSVHIPGVTDHVVYDPVPISGDGRFSPLVYEVVIKDSYNQSDGYLPCLVKIVDSYPTGQNPNPNLDGYDLYGREDATDLELFGTSEFVTYQYLQIYVIPCAGTDLRPGVSPIDIGVDSSGSLLIVYEDFEVWRYDTGYCHGNYLYTAELDQIEYILGLDCQNDGRSIVIAKACET